MKMRLEIKYQKYRYNLNLKLKLHIWVIHLRLIFHENTIVLIAKENKRTPCKNKQNSWLKRVEYDK